MYADRIFSSQSSRWPSCNPSSGSTCSIRHASASHLRRREHARPSVAAKTLHAACVEVDDWYARHMRGFAHVGLTSACCNNRLHARSQLFFSIMYLVREALWMILDVQPAIDFVKKSGRDLTLVLQEREPRPQSSERRRAVAIRTKAEPQHHKCLPCKQLLLTGHATPTVSSGGTPSSKTPTHALILTHWTSSNHRNRLLSHQTIQPALHSAVPTAELPQQYHFM